MRKKTKSLILATGLFLFSSIFGIVISNVYTSSNANAATTNAVCQGIANDENNNIYETTAQLNPEPRYRTLLKYDVTLGDASNFTNVVASTGQGIKINGVSLNQIPNCLVDYANGSSYIRIKIPVSYQDALTGNIILEVVEGTAFENKILDGSKFVLADGKWKKVNEVTFTGIKWNNTGYNEYASMKGVLLEFNANLSKKQNEIDGGIRSTNFASTIGENIYLGGHKLSTMDGAFVGYYCQNFLFVYAKNMTSYRLFELKNQTPALDSILPEVNLAFEPNEWTTTSKKYSEVTFKEIKWNDIGYNEYASMNGVMIGYNTNLSKVQTEIDGGIRLIDYTPSIGDHILLGDQKLSSLPGAFVGYYALNYIFIYAHNMPSYRTLKIEEGAHFIDSSLPELNLYYTASNKWSTKKEESVLVSFSSILWNNAGYDVYEGKNGVLLSFSDNLSNAPSEIEGGIKTVNNVSSEIGNRIKLDQTPLKNIANSEIMYFGSSFLWVYAPNMNQYKKLTIESGEFLTCILPDVTFGFYETEWVQIYKVSITINGAEIVDYRKKNEVTVLSEGYFASLFSEQELSLRLLSFKTGGKTYYQNDSLEINKETSVVVTAIRFETTKGASARMSNKSGIRFETKLNKDDYNYLLELYGKENIETGTYIVPKNSIGLTSFDSYFNNPSKVEGKDYSKIINSGFINDSTIYKYNGAVNNILPSDYCTEYCGIGYFKLTDGLVEYTVYGGNKLEVFSRSIYDVIKRAYGDYESGSVEKADITRQLDGILSLESDSQGMKIENIADGYVSPYSISFDSSSNQYTVIGASKVNTILINGEKKISGGNIVNIGNNLFKLTNFNIQTSEESTVVTFKLASIADAASLVDFVIEMPSNREMKILQLTDTQIIDSSQMRSPTRLGPSQVEAYSRKNVDKNCFNHIKELIEKENPDLILFSGDIVYGEFDDSGEILTRIVEFMDSFNIPWAPIFGNHDNETNKGVDWQCSLFENAKNCLFKQGELTGNGNYSIGLVDNQGRIQRVIYMFDSNGCITGAGLGEDQLNWMTNTSSSIDAVYDKDIPGFACMHIPSKDFQVAITNKYGYKTGETFNLDEDGEVGDFGQCKEKMSIFGAEISSYLKAANIDGVFAGHDHVNNFSVLYDGIRYTYGTKTGIYDYYNSAMLGGTLIRANTDGAFDVSPTYLNENKMKVRESASTTFTVMSDIHHDHADYGGFHCTKSRQKLKKIVNETPDSRFYINLGDTVNSDTENLYNYYEAMSTMKEVNLNVYNREGTGYNSGNRMIYNLLGNHEVAYSNKNKFTNYSPYVEGIGTATVFKRDNLMFVAVDALFDRATGSDDPSIMITCTKFTIPDAEIAWLKEEVKNAMDNNVQGIVWISHVALQDIDEESKGKLLKELKGYSLPMTIFEGHTHIEAYHELTDDITGEVYCQEYTLPAVTLNDNYPYYVVTFKDGKIWCIDKRTSGVIE